MHINLLNRKTCKIQKLKLNKQAKLSSIKTLALAAIADNNRYAVSVCADSQDDIELIYNTFHNVPVPYSLDVKKAIWTGDIAAFIILNFPTVTDE